MCSEPFIYVIKIRFVTMQNNPTEFEMLLKDLRLIENELAALEQYYQHNKANLLHDKKKPEKPY